MPTTAIVPDLHCPGSRECPDEGDDVLLAGAALAEITPSEDDIREYLVVDVDGDGEYDPGEDEFLDADEDGHFDGVWMAGFGNGRAARGIHDPQWVRALVLRQNETTIAIAAVDLVGYFNTEVRAIRDALPSDLGIDYLLVAATHTHEARDTVGIWGLDETSSGADEEYDSFVRAQIAVAIEEATTSMVPATITYGTRRTADHERGLVNYVSDTRDPVVIDDRLTVLRFAARDDGHTVGTLVNWGSHAEYTGDENTFLSSDFPHWVRLGVEDGVSGGDVDLRGTGGVCLFVNGAIGGQIGPGWVEVEDLEGVVHDEEGFARAEAVGTNVAAVALRALEEGVTEETADLSFRLKRFRAPVENWAYQTMFLVGVIRRELHGFDPDLPIDEHTNLPELESEVATVRIGRAEAIVMPGEVFPELMVGGYVGGWTGPEWEVIETMADCDPELDEDCVPPDLSLAPEGPFLLERLDADYPMTWGLAGDELGYFVPAYDYALHPTLPYFEEPHGDHYEETNSVGPSTWGILEATLVGVIEWKP